MYEAIPAASEPLLLLDLPGERILSASDSAKALLTPDGSEPVGRTLSEFLDVPAGEAVELLAKGRLDGFGLRRVGRAEPAGELEIWVVRPAATGPALALLARPGEGLRWASEPAAPTPPGTGWVDRQLRLQQFSDEVPVLLGQPGAELLGASLLTLPPADDLAALLFAIGHVTSSRDVVSLTIRLARSDRSSIGGQLVLVAANPAPSFAFAIRPALAPGEGEDPWLPLRRFGQGLAAAGKAGELADDQPRPLLPELTGRELQIVNRLLAGDRVPAISRQLYLAQSTVRNHLSAVFAKLGVRSQQELIVLLRKAQSRQE